MLAVLKSYSSYTTNVQLTLRNIIVPAVSPMVTKVTENCSEEERGLLAIQTGITLPSSKGTVPLKGGAITPIITVNNKKSVEWVKFEDSVAYTLKVQWPTIKLQLLAISI